MADTRQTKLTAALNATSQEQVANGKALVDLRRHVLHRDPGAAAQTAGRGKMMITEQLAHPDCGAVENLLRSHADGGQEPSLWLAARDARSSLARAQEHAAIEAQDVLSQADEALVLG